MTATNPFKLASDAAAALRDRLGGSEHDLLLVLGSGWSEAADEIGEIVCDVELSDLPGFPAPKVDGHRNLARSLLVGRRKVLLLGGRVHLYEGFTANEVVHSIRTASAAGCGQAILTNAAGGISPSLEVGRLALITDHLNLTGTSPMAGAAPPMNYPGRFCDLSSSYSPAMRRAALDTDATLAQGVYAGMFGGAYETPAEVRMLATLGADLVGMSTVLETIAARHLGMEVLGISLVTNMAAGITEGTLDHADVLGAAADSKDRIVGLIRATIERLPLPGDDATGA